MAGEELDTGVPLLWCSTPNGKTAGAVSETVIGSADTPAAVATCSVALPVKFMGNCALICPGDTKNNARGVPSRVTLVPEMDVDSGYVVAAWVSPASARPKMLTRPPGAIAGV